jgi:hypothetical protein
MCGCVARGQRPALQTTHANCPSAHWASPPVTDTALLTVRDPTLGVRASD